MRFDLTSGAARTCIGLGRLRSIPQLLRTCSASTISHARWKHDDHSQPKRNLYSQGEIDTIFRERKAGKTFREIAIQSNRSEGSLTTVFRRISRKYGEPAGSARPKRPFTPTEIDEISRLRDAKTTWTEIGILLGRDGSAAHRGFQHHTLHTESANYKNFNAAWPSDAIETLHHMHDDLKMSWSAISAVMGRTIPSLVRKYHERKTVHPRGPQRWNAEEDQLLNTLRGEKSLPWTDVSRSLPGRTLSACQSCFRKLASSGLSCPHSFSTVAPLIHRHQRGYLHTVSSGTECLRPVWRRSADKCLHRLIHTEENAPKRMGPYTAEEDRIILQRRREHVSFPDITTELGRASLYGVKSRFRTLLQHGEPGNIKRMKPLSDSEHEQIAQKRAAGIHWSDIAPLFNRSAKICANLHARYKEARLQSHLRYLSKRPWKDAEVTELMHSRDCLGLSWHIIAESLQRSQRSISSKYHSVKLEGRESRPTHKNGYTVEEDNSILYLREVLNLTWKELQHRIPHRTQVSLRNRHRDYLRPTPAADVHTREYFTIDDYTLLDELRNTQQLSWDEVRAKMPNYSTEDLQNRHALLIKWPPSAKPSSPTKLSQSRTFTTLAESPFSLYGTSAKTFSGSSGCGRVGTCWTPISRPKGQSSRAYHAPSNTSKRSGRRKFTEAEVLKMVEKRKEGKSHALIVMELGVGTVPGISGAINRWAVKNGDCHLIHQKRTDSIEEHQRVKHMRALGMNWYEIAAHCQRSKNHVASQYRHMEESLALKTGGKGSRHQEPFTESDLRFVVHSRDVLRLPWAEIALQQGRTPLTVKTRYYQHRASNSGNGPSHRKTPFSREELDKIAHLRGVRKLSWDEIQVLMPKRAKCSLQVRWSRMMAEAKAGL